MQISDAADRTMRWIWALLVSVCAGAAWHATTTYRLAVLEANQHKAEVKETAVDQKLAAIGESLGRIEERQSNLGKSVDEIKATIREMKRQ